MDRFWWRGSAVVCVCLKAFFVLPSLVSTLWTVQLLDALLVEDEDGGFLSVRKRLLLETFPPFAVKK